jgi:hypothetical protein
MSERRSHARGQLSNKSSSSRSELSNLLNNLSLESSSDAAEEAESGNLLLLTPYLHYPPPNTPPSLAMDPFEPFGRALTAYHRRIQHVPYVAKRGMIDVHRELMAEAGAAIVVICDSSASSGLEGERLDRVKDQERFARAIGKLTQRMGILSILVLVGVPRGERTGNFGVVETCDDCQELEEMAEVIFGG